MMAEAPGEEMGWPLPHSDPILRSLEEILRSSPYSSSCVWPFAVLCR